MDGAGAEALFLRFDAALKRRSSTALRTVVIGVGYTRGTGHQIPPSSLRDSSE